MARLRHRMAANKVAETRELADQKKEAATDAAKIANVTKNHLPPKSVKTAAISRGSNSQASLEALLSPTSQGAASMPVVHGGPTLDIVPDRTSKSTMSASFLTPVVAEFTPVVLSIGLSMPTFQTPPEALWFWNWSPPWWFDDVDRARMHVNKGSHPFSRSPISFPNLNFAGCST